MTVTPTENRRSGEWSPFADPALTREYRIGIVRRLLENSRRQLHSGIWLSVEEVEAVLSAIPSAPAALTPRQTINELPPPDAQV